MNVTSPIVAAGGRLQLLAQLGRRHQQPVDRPAVHRRQVVPHNLAQGDTVILAFYTFIDGCTSFLRDLLSNLAVIAVIFYQNDDIAPG
jgi:hypothetical protein